MRRLVVGLAAITLLSGTALADSGLVNVESKHDVATTAARLVQALESKGLTIFARIDHAEGAAKAGMDLPATQLVIFGNPKVGTPLIQCNRTVAIDLPQKALVWEDTDGTVRLTYNNPAYLSERHELGECSADINKIAGILANFAKVATDSD